MTGLEECFWRGPNDILERAKCPKKSTLSIQHYIGIKLNFSIVWECQIVVTEHVRRAMVPLPPPPPPGSALVTS